MGLEPHVSAIIHIDDEDYAFVAVDGAPNVVYAEPGRKAKVYKLYGIRTKKYKALKVFFPEDRTSAKDQNLLHSTERLNSLYLRKYSSLEERLNSGLAVAERKVITPENNKNLIKNYPNFAYSIFMNWMGGESWSNYVTNKVRIKPEISKELARSFCRVITGLEKRGVAHCDLSPGNFVFDKNGLVELVDIEDMYASDFSEPIPYPAGTPGYVPKWVMDQGLWKADADRLAGAILICEILCWQYDDVCNFRHDTSYFAPGEMGRNTKRYIKMRDRLGEINPAFVPLFNKVWQAQNITEAPPLSAWNSILNASVIDSELLKCKNCSNVVQKYWKACPYCGTKLIDEGDNGPSYGKPILKISTDSLNYVIDKITSVPIQIQNTGTGILRGSIEKENWLILSKDTFELQPNEMTEITIKLSNNFPHIDNGDTYWFPKGIIIHSNADNKVIGGRYSRPARPGLLDFLKF